MPINDTVAAEQWYRFRWCVERGHYEYLEKAQRCEDFFAGMQWTQDDLAKLKRQGRPALTINKILSTMATIMGEQIYNRNDVLFRPSAGARAETAEALTKVWMQISQNNQLPWVRSDVFCDGIIRSRGFYDVRLDFNDAMQGEVRIDQLNGKNVVVDPDAEKYDPDEWNDVFITKWLTYQDIATLYNEDDAEYLRDREASMFPYAYDSIERVRDRFSGSNLQGSYYGILDSAGVRRNIRAIERQYRKLDKQRHFVDVVTGDTRPIPDGWDRNKIASVLEKGRGQLNVIKKLVKRVRWTVTADHVVLHDDWSPYKHFTVVPYFPFFRYGRTIGLVENLISSQELLNKSSSQELHIVNTTANSGWKVKAGSLVNMTTEQLKTSGAQTGLVLELKDVGDAEKISPNQVPTGLDRVGFKAEEHIKSISGVSDSMQGFDREDVAAKAIAYKQQRGSINMTKVMDNLERSDFILARNVLDLIQSYYTEERLLSITHDDLTREPEMVTINQMTPEGEIINDLTVGEYNIIVTSTPARASMEDSQFEQALALRKEGVQIPDKFIIESSRLPRRSEIVKAMESEANSPEAQQMRELQMRAQAAEVEKLEGEAKGKHTKAALDTARAQKEAEGDGGLQAEIMRMREELQMERERMTMEMQQSREEHALKLQELAAKLQGMEQQLAMKRDEHAQTMALRQEQAEQDARMRREEHYERRAEEAARAAEGSSTEEKQA